MSERHLLIVAHGSRRQASNDEVRELGERVRAMRDPAIHRVDVAFLELAEPSIPDGLARCAAQGAREIIVFPYFLAAGTHVATDIPEALATFSEIHPDIQVRLASHLGASASLAKTILDIASKAG
ncbi:MAG: cobalamin biosynthesis protein CbiX [Hydrogenophilales bacterium 28-61-23]|nr:MAG: cobalamin biosynthesis protein CbiX [Hydrogenophilales bacterium 28-61-23]